MPQPKQPAPVTALQPTRLPISQAMAKEFSLSAAQWRVLVDQIFPSAKTVEAVLMALEYCKVRNLDIYKRPVHIVPMYSTALQRMVETVWPSIAEIRTTAARTGLYAGIDAPVLGPMIDTTFTGEVDNWEHGNRAGTRQIEETVTYPEWASVVAYKMVGNQRVPFNAVIYWRETYASVGKTSVPNAMWCKRPIGQFVKCLEAAVLRMAFPEEVGSMYAAEEMEGRIIEGVAETVTEALQVAVPRSMPPSPPKAPAVDPATPGADPEPDDENLPPIEPLQAEEEVQALLDEIEASLKEARTQEEVDARFNNLQVQLKLSGRDAALMEAFEIKGYHMGRTNVDPETEADAQ